jgi:penicillin V acylase-like amidase (Ntn superfamily)
MWGGDTDPTPNALPSLNELQWIQFQLDNFSTVDEVVENLSSYRWSRVFGFVHYLTCDASGRCAAIEPLYEETPLVHANQEMFVNTLANDTYEDSVNFLKLHSGFGGSLNIPSGVIL